MADPYASHRERQQAGQEFFSHWPRQQVTQYGANYGTHRAEVVPPIFSDRVSPEEGFRETGNQRIDLMHSELRDRETRFAELSRQYNEQFDIALKHGPTVVAPNTARSQQLYQETGIITPGLNPGNPGAVPKVPDIDEAIRRNPNLRVIHKEQKKEWFKITNLLKTLSRGHRSRRSYQAGRKKRATLIDEEDFGLERRTLVGA